MTPGAGRCHCRGWDEPTMYIRCTECKALTQVQIPAASAGPTAVACSGCGRRYRLAVARPKQNVDQARYRQAKGFAETNRIDLASAYSVLEGVMTLEDAAASRKGPIPSAPAAEQPAAPPSASVARPAPATVPAITGSSAAQPRSAPAGKSPVPSTPVMWEEEAAYDPGFKSAVKEGRLTVSQALERGDRRSLALRVSQRHRMSMDLALKVADNRITVRQALDQKSANESKEPPRPQTSVSHGVWNFMVLSVGLLILGALGVHIYHVWGDYLARNGAPGFETEVASAAERPRPPEPPPQAVPIPPPALTVPRTDSTGQLVQVEGPDPRSVLISFCATGRQAGHREPVEILPGVPPSSSLRFGIFRSLDQQAIPVRAIRIRLDPRSGRWLTGDGRSPIVTEAPPPHIPGGRGEPVSPGGSPAAG